MYVVRFTHSAKQGRTGELAELFKSTSEYGFPAPPHGWRLYQPSHLGPWGVVVNELEFESLAQYEEWDRTRLAVPRFGEVIAKVYELAGPSGSGELWRVETLK